MLTHWSIIAKSISIWIKASWFLDNIWKFRTQWSLWWWFGSITKVGRRQQPRRNHQEWSKTSKHFYIYGLLAQCESCYFFWHLSKTTIQLWQLDRNTSKLSVCSVTLIYLLLVYIQSQCLTGIVFVVEEKLLHISPVQLSLLKKKYFQVKLFVVLASIDITVSAKKSK